MSETLVGQKTIAFSIAQEILATSVKIPTLPDNGQKIVQTVRTPKDDIDIPGFVKLLESDPGLFTQILKLANSSYYRGVEEVVSLRGAITRIGLVETVNSVSFYFFQKLLPKFPDIQGFKFNEFWAHSWACAIACRRLGHPNLDMGVLPGDLYMIGMLQGIGKLFLSIHFPDDFATCIRVAEKRELPLSQIEQDVFGTTDNLIASRVLSAWNMPSNICEAVAFCHIPEQAPPEHKILAGLSQYAHSIVGMSGVGHSGDGKKIDVQDTYFGGNTRLKIGQPEIQERLVAEIIDSVTEKEEEETSKKQPSSAAKKTPVNKTAKRGLFGWVKSFLE